MANSKTETLAAGGGQDTKRAGRNSNVGIYHRGSHSVVAYRLKRFVCGVMIASSRNDKTLKIESDAEVHRSFVSLEGLACRAG